MSDNYEIGVNLKNIILHIYSFFAIGQKILIFTFLGIFVYRSLVGELIKIQNHTKIWFLHITEKTTDVLQTKHSYTSIL